MRKAWLTFSLRWFLSLVQKLMRMKIEKEIVTVLLELNIYKYPGSYQSFDRKPRSFVSTSDCSSEWLFLYNIMHCLWFPLLISFKELKEFTNNIKVLWMQYLRFFKNYFLFVLTVVTATLILTVSFLATYTLSRLLKPLNLVFLEVITPFSTLVSTHALTC